MPNTLDALLHPGVRAEPGEPCKVTAIVESLEEPYRTAADRLANLRPAQGGVSDMKAAAQFAAAGLRVSHSMINRHRNGWCPCPPREEEARD